MLSTRSVSAAKRIFLCLAAILLAFCMCCTIAYAEETGDDTTGTSEEGPVTQGMFAGIMSAEINGIEGLHSFSQSVAGNAILGENSTLRNLWIAHQGDINNLYNVVLSIGLSLTAAYFMVHILREMTDGRANLEGIIKPFIYFVVAVLIMSHGMEILDAFIDLGATLGKEIMQVPFQDGSGINIAEKVISEDKIALYNSRTGIFDRLGDIFSLLGQLLGQLLQQIPWLYIQIIVYMRFFQMIIRAFFAPLALGDIYSGGPNPTAVRYIRGFLAVCLQGVIIVGAMIVYSFLVPTGGDSPGFLTSIVFFFALMGFVSKTEGLARELCGV